MTVLNIRVVASGDDGACGSNEDFSNTGVQLVMGKGAEFTYDSFFRFLNVTIPSGSTIDTAILRIVVKTSSNGVTVYTNIAAEDADNPSAPISYADMTGRVRTTALTAWDGIAAWTAEDTKDSPDFAAVIQEVIDRGGWSSGNAVIIFIDNDGSSVDAYRYPYAYDGDTAKAVELRITYTAYEYTASVAGALTSSGAVRGKALKRIAGAITYAGALSVFAELFYQAVVSVLTFIGTIASRVLRGAEAVYEYRIDTTTIDMDNVETLLGIAPAGVRFRHHPIIQQSGTGMSGGSGYPQCEWAFDFLSWASLALMLAFLGGDESVSLYINTRRPDDTYGLYSAIMHRPHVPGEAMQIIGGWRNVTFRFTHLESV